MNSINSTNLGRYVSRILSLRSNGAQFISARVDSVFDQLTALYFLALGKNATGVVYAFVRITKPVWTLSPRRADFANRTS